MTLEQGKLAQDIELQRNQGTIHDKNSQEETNAELDAACQDEHANDGDYPHGMKLAVIVGSLAASVFLVALDETIITTAIPKITDDFHSINDIGWYGSAYFMTFAAFQLIFGKLFSFYPIKYVFLASVAIFEVGSLICATSSTSNAFIVGRAFAGLGSAGINAGFIIILASSLPLARRPIFVSSYSGMYGIASVVAPLLGGAFTTKMTWRWCFYINLPIGGAAVLAMALFFHPPAGAKKPSTTWQQKLGQVDLFGTAVLVPGIICLLLALQWGGSVYKWNTAPPITLLSAAGVAGLAFVIVQVWKQESATVPPRIIKQRSVAFSAFYVFHAGGALNVIQYFIPIWFQAIQGVTAFDSGSRILPTTLGTVVFSLVAGIGVAKFGYYTPFMILGAVFLVTGATLITTWQVSSPATQWIGYQLVFSAGAGLGIQQSHTAAQTVLASVDVPVGAVVMIFAQILGGAMWLSVAQTVLTSQLLKGLVDAVPGIDPKLVLDKGATGFRETVRPEYLGDVLKVYNFALTRTIYCGVALAAAALIASMGMEWKSIKRYQAVS
ncbi:azole resistance protein 1 [Nannizzia gypsea CBS 118893]|uniref:Azole resistance protein 1 n=1 Tax=Arthroderma gypseum (strain ATCC MYA-4604 / CBS 118893) TaxID=535722 RepID=E4UQ11_ARTGP|nr:azole resistance protein 1 [Nannizzia gypsea CBS 118893]EFQ99145.1 azole resistance protein 1 [Nannizzia gypsea CBS 118893]